MVRGLGEPGPGAVRRSSNGPENQREERGRTERQSHAPEEDRQAALLGPGPEHGPELLDGSLADARQRLAGGGVEVGIDETEQGMGAGGDKQAVEVTQGYRLRHDLLGAHIVREGFDPPGGVGGAVGRADLPDRRAEHYDGAVPDGECCVGRGASLRPGALIRSGRLGLERGRGREQHQRGRGQSLEGAPQRYHALGSYGEPAGGVMGQRSYIDPGRRVKVP